jgi:hypothetical protein
MYSLCVQLRCLASKIGSTVENGRRKVGGVTDVTRRGRVVFSDCGLRWVPVKQA